jgi:hypothetical protein
MEVGSEYRVGIRERNEAKTISRPRSKVLGRWDSVGVPLEGCKGMGQEVWLNGGSPLPLPVAVPDSSRLEGRDSRRPSARTGTGRSKGNYFWQSSVLSYCASPLHASPLPLICQYLPAQPTLSRCVSRLSQFRSRVAH